MISTGLKLKSENSASKVRISINAGFIAIVPVVFICRCSYLQSEAFRQDQDINQKVPSEISAQIRDRAYMLDEVYEKYRREDPDLKGEMVLKIAVKPNGKVTGVYIDSTDMENQLFKLEACGLVQKWWFDLQFKGDPILIRYDFHFAPSAKKE